MPYATRLAALLGGTLAAVLCLPAPPARATGSWSVESQYHFTPDATLTVVSPFVDGQGRPWVLANYQNLQDPTDAHCVFIGPFDQDDPPSMDWSLPDAGSGVPTTLCLAVEPGPANGLLVRGVERTFDLVTLPPPPPQDNGFIISLDGDFQINWGPTFDAEQVEVGQYSGPLAPIAWSDQRDRVLEFFNGVIVIGADQATELHGVSIAEGTGLVRRVVTDWGGVSNGELQGLLVRPDDGRFLVVAHANATEFLVYDGLESVQALVPGDVDWSNETVDHVQFGDDQTLYIVHHPRLDFGTTSATLTHVSGDGATQYYTRDLARTVEVDDPLTGEPQEVELQRPVLSYVTTSTATFVRAMADQFVLHVYDNFNGQELAVQPLATIDSHIPTNMADAHASDRLILMTVDDASPMRFLDTIAWQGGGETPGDIAGGEDVAAPDAGGSDTGGTPDAGGADTGGGGSGGGGCCETAPGSLTPHLWMLVLGLLALRARRRPTGV